jgi:predicted Zn-dependent protease
MMKTQFFKSILMICAVGFTMTGCKPKSVNDCGFVQNVYGQRISWKSKEPIELILTNQIPAQLRPAIYRAVKTWEDRIGEKVFNVTEDFTRASGLPTKDGKSAIYFLSSWEADRTSEQGRTSIYWAADQIMEADIRINAQDFSFYDKETNELVGPGGIVHAVTDSHGDRYNFEALILHELGHLLGLKHSTGGGSVMVTHLGSGADRITPSEADSKNVKCVYGN